MLINQHSSLLQGVSMSIRVRPLILVLLFMIWSPVNAQSGPSHEVDAIFEKWDMSDSPGCAVSVIRERVYIELRPRPSRSFL
jgi:hypothetical protein